MYDGLAFTPRVRSIVKVSWPMNRGENSGRSHYRGHRTPPVFYRCFFQSPLSLRYPPLSRHLLGPRWKIPRLETRAYLLTLIRLVFRQARTNLILTLRRDSIGSETVANQKSAKVNCSARYRIFFRKKKFVSAVSQPLVVELGPTRDF